MSLSLRNPHSVLAALQTRPSDVLEVRLHSRHAGTAWDAVAEECARHRIPVRRGVPHAGRRSGKMKGGAQTERVGAGEATVRERNDVSPEELFSSAAQRADGHGIWLALDRVQDPRNLGAIFRSAAFFGVQGALLTKDQSAPFSGVAYDTAAGGLEHVPFHRPSNLARSLQIAKDAGLWILGTSEYASQDIADVPRDRPWLVVMGGEEKGMRRLTADLCDETCRLTPRGAVQSLNVSVAAAVTLASLTAR